MGFISWIVLGLLVGILAKWIMPGRAGDRGRSYRPVCLQQDPQLTPNAIYV
ncbi:GlsB/YeaQ/YmgE family stress response membrane protein [Aeromonas veronii]|uniref:GlsB/YeaQ/YmgE family stress response membrane protein n=1 Tax=Aeromonas veronii TaxID=654 RepID=UPI003A1C4BD1